MPRHKPNRNIFGCVESLRGIRDSLRFEARMITAEDADLKVVQHSIKKLCDELDEATRALDEAAGPIRA